MGIRTTFSYESPKETQTLLLSNLQMLACVPMPPYCKHCISDQAQGIIQNNMECLSLPFDFTSDQEEDQPLPPAFLTLNLELTSSKSCNPLIQQAFSRMAQTRKSLHRNSDSAGAMAERVNRM
jgi:hypothetical protein